MPLTLITGIFGMNFEMMPLLKDRGGFWIVMAAMALMVVVLLFFFRRKRYLEDHAREPVRVDGKRE
jgi:LPXTG-motif cell wall-anchored protein